jgi:hypothetical protein
MRWYVGVLVFLAYTAAVAIEASADDAPSQTAPAAQGADAPLPVYKPPLRGAPGGRIGGASRSAVRPVTPLPIVELLAPADHAGLTSIAEPVLYFFVSRPVGWPTQFTISAPQQPAPALEVTIPTPQAAGFYPLRLSDYGVRLRPGIVYSWSVSILIKPKEWSRNIVATATIVFDPTVGSNAARLVPPLQRAARLADAGLWYDAVAAAADVRNSDRRALDALIQQAGLKAAASY